MAPCRGEVGTSVAASQTVALHVRQRAGLRRGVAVPALLVALASACELAEVATPVASEDLVVVESLLRVGDEQQTVLLHRTINGRDAEAVVNAEVLVRTPEGRAVVFAEAPPPVCYSDRKGLVQDSLGIAVGCYASPDTTPAWVRPGETYELHVATAEGERLRSRTTVPGIFELRTPGVSPDARGLIACSLPPGQELSLEWTRAPGAWIYLSEVEIFGLRAALAGTGIPPDEIPEPLALTGLSISEADTTLILPTEAGVFERFDFEPGLLEELQGGFPDGVRVRVTIAAMDRNFVNAVRGGGFNPSGNTRISSIVGEGIGLFGSLLARTLFIEVGHSSQAPPCMP